MQAFTTEKMSASEVVKLGEGKFPVACVAGQKGLAELEAENLGREPAFPGEVITTVLWPTGFKLRYAA